MYTGLCHESLSFITPKGELTFQKNKWKEYSYEGLERKSSNGLLIKRLSGHHILFLGCKGELKKK